MCVSKLTDLNKCLMSQMLQYTSALQLGSYLCYIQLLIVTVVLDITSLCLGRTSISKLVADDLNYYHQHHYYYYKVNNLAWYGRGKADGDSLYY